MELVKRSTFGWGPTAAGLATPRNGLVIHYDGSDQGLAGKPHSACVTYWKNTRKFHMGQARGWADIGYSFGACPHGVVFEGRGEGHVQAAQPGGNTTWYSVTLMSGPGEKPTDAQIDAVRQLRAWLMRKGVGGAVKGHRDFFSTSCPGDLLYRMVRDGTFTKPAGSGDSPASEPASASSWTEDLVKDLPLLKEGADNFDVKTVRALLVARGRKPEDMDLLNTRFGPELTAKVKDFQKVEGLDADGIVGPKSWAKLLRR